MEIQVLGIMHSDAEIKEAIAMLEAAGADLIDINGENVLYRGYMTVDHAELWEVDTHGAREYWVMSHCDFSTRYMYKRRYRVANRYHVVGGNTGVEWYEVKSAALRAAGKYGDVYRYDMTAVGKWWAVEEVKRGRKWRH